MSTGLDRTLHLWARREAVPQDKRYPRKARNGDDDCYGQISLEPYGKAGRGWDWLKQFEGEYSCNAEVDRKREPPDSDKECIGKHPKYSHGEDIWASCPGGRTIGIGEVDASGKEDTENDSDGPGNCREDAG